MLQQQQSYRDEKQKTEQFVSFDMKKWSNLLSIKEIFFEEKNKNAAYKKNILTKNYVIYTLIN